MGHAVIWLHDIINSGKEQAKGLDIFVGKFALPVLIFSSLAQLDFGQVLFLSLESKFWCMLLLFKISVCIRLIGAL